eukprot:scaffold71750_cov30-Tisochrysis_lutea.AAC.4
MAGRLCGRGTPVEAGGGASAWRRPWRTGQRGLCVCARARAYSGSFRHPNCPRAVAPVTGGTTGATKVGEAHSSEMPPGANAP